MNNLMTLWSEGFKRHYPSVRAEVEGKGSSTAPPALIAGTATFGPMSRDMKTSEIDAFDAKYGYKPVLLPAAIDMLAVYVHRDNPIQRLSLGQLDAIYSQHRKGGYRRTLAPGARWDSMANGTIARSAPMGATRPRAHTPISRRTRVFRRRLSRIRDRATGQFIRGAVGSRRHERDRL